MCVCIHKGRSCVKERRRSHAHWQLIYLPLVRGRARPVCTHVQGEQGQYTPTPTPTPTHIHTHTLSLSLSNAHTHPWFVCGLCGLRKLGTPSLCCCRCRPMFGTPLPVEQRFKITALFHAYVASNRPGTALPYCLPPPPPLSPTVPCCMYLTDVFETTYVLTP